MHLRTAALLLLAVLALGGLAWWQQKRESTPELTGVRELAPGLQREAIQAVRIDSLERGEQMRLQVSSEGVWRLTDPIDYGAEVSLVEQLLDSLTKLPVEPWQGDPNAVGLTRPRAVLEVEQRAGQGTRTRRIELGATDVDRQHVFLRVDGELVRASSALATVLELPLPEWRDRAVLPSLSPLSILTLERSGKTILPGGTEVDLALSVLREQRGWKATAPYVAALGPEAIGTLLSSLCSLRVAGFEDDAPAGLENYGLEPPDFRIVLTTVRGDSYALRFSRRGGSERFLCVREGFPHVFSIAPETMPWVVAPFEALVDLELARAPRERIERVRLRAEGRETVLERKGFGWTVQCSGGGGPQLAAQKADTERVSDLLGRIERARVSEILPGVEFAPASGGELGVYVEFEDEMRGGELGAEFASPRGTRGLLFRRAGDTLASLVPADLAELARTDPLGLRSDELHKVSELDIVQVQVAANWAKLRRTWGRDERGRWMPEGSTAEAVDFARIVDQLMTVRAKRLLTPGEEPEGQRAVAVALIDRGGATRAAFALQLLSGTAEAPEAAEVLYLNAEQRAVIDGRLYFALAEILPLP
jgi:Domain of unknown function (DUF4340)